MGFPLGMQLATVAFGIPLTATGKDVVTTVTVKPSARVIWSATGQPVPEFSDSFTALAGQLGTFQVPFVNQTGFIDSTGATFTDWAYQITAEWRFGSERLTWSKNFKPLVGQTGTIDLDLVPDGPVSIPVTAPTAAVLGFHGRTGFITIQESDLPARLSEASLSATYALKGQAGGSITFVTLTAAGQAVSIPDGPVAGVALVQDSTGGRTVAWPAGVRWDGGTVPTLSTGAGMTDVFTFVAVTGNGWLGKKDGSYAAPAGPADTTAPSTLTGLTAGTPTSSSIPLSWTASTDNVGIAGYEYSLNGTSWTATGSTGTTYTVTGLSASTAYTIQVRAYDAAGNKGTAASVSATTAASSDATAPSAPTNLAGTAGQTTVDLSWTASTDNVGVTGYRVSKDNGATWITSSVTGTTYQVTGLTAGTSYTFAVAARDAAGNWSTNATLTKSTTGASLSWVSMASDTFTAADGTALNGRVMETGGLTYVTNAGFTIQGNKATTNQVDTSDFDTPIVETGSTIHRVSYDYDISGQKNGNAQHAKAFVWFGGTRTGANPTSNTRHHVRIKKAAYNSTVAALTGTTDYAEALVITAQNGKDLNAIPLVGKFTVETLADGMTINVLIDNVLWATVARLPEAMTVGTKAYAQMFAAVSVMDNILVEAYK